MCRFLIGFLIALCAFHLPIESIGQCTIRGKVVDENGESLPGAVVSPKNDPSKGTVTDLDGNYSLRVSDSTRQAAIVFSMVGLQKSEEIIDLVKGGVVLHNVILYLTAQQIKEVEISAKAVKASDFYYETIKKKSASSIDYISSEVIKKTGDNTVTAAIARVSGVSTNGALITVRGIGDRYVRTTINGSRIPTLDPFTNNIRLDLFPTGLVDNIVLTKTASPELPGDWAGAYISVQTKDYPEQLSVGVETTFGYNTQSTFRDVLSSERSKTDWLGYDKSLRERSHDNFNLAYQAPTPYQQFVALGLYDYYRALGVSESNWGLGTPTGDTYYRLGLVQLGLLAPAQIEDISAVQAAVALYESEGYRNQAFNIINAPAAATGQSFSNNWNTMNRVAPLNFSQSFSIGNQATLFGKTVGYLFGFRYSTSTVSDPNSTAARASVAQDPSGELVPFVASKANQNVSRETNGWSALLNVAMKLNSNNTISFLVMPNLTGVNNVRFSEDRQDPTNYVLTNSQFYEQRKQLIYQLSTEHYLPESKIRMTFSSSYTDGKSKAPDFKNVQYFLDPISNGYLIGGNIGDGIHRYYRYLTDNVWDNRFAMEKPIFDKEGLIRKIGAGVSADLSYKQSGQYDYFINFGPFSRLDLVNNDLDQLFAPSSFALGTYTDQNGIVQSTLDAYYGVFDSPANFTFGRSNIYSGYLMTDYALTKRWRFAGGLRVERAEIFTDVVLFDSLGYAPNDPRRSYSLSYPLANPGELSETNFLPSLNVVYRFNDSEELPMNLRLSYSHTVARPSIRELSDIAQLDYEFRSFVFGNSDLKTVRVDNYDCRYEFYPRTGYDFSVSLFYKKFRDHIEIVKSVGLTWQNVDNSYVAGFELEGHCKLHPTVDLTANISVVKSETEFVRKRLDLSDGVKTYFPLDTVRRPMFGQAPYVFNAILTYTPEKYGLAFTVSYNLQGPRLVIASDVKEVPDIYELPRNVIDIKATKKLGNHFTASLTIKDLLNAPIRRNYNYQDGFELDFDYFRFGTIIQAGITYKL
ncbi:MAG: hypothetical protein RIQ47_359 [Bacteroidota bacterium]